MRSQLNITYQRWAKTKAQKLECTDKEPQTSSLPQHHPHHQRSPGPDGSSCSCRAYHWLARRSHRGGRMWNAMTSLAGAVELWQKKYDPSCYLQLKHQWCMVLFLCTYLVCWQCALINSSCAKCVHSLLCLCVTLNKKTRRYVSTL